MDTANEQKENVEETLKKSIALPEEPTAVAEVVNNIGDVFTIPEEVKEAPEVEEKFDPATMERIKRKDGKWRRKRGGAVRSTTETKRKGVEETGSVSSKPVAASAVFLFSLLGGALCGDTFRPSTVEAEELTTTLTTYLDAKGITDIPPGLAVAIAFIGFAANKVATDEKCRKKLTEKIQKVKGIFSKKERNGSRHNCGDNRDRQNDASESDS